MYFIRTGGVGSTTSKNSKKLQYFLFLEDGSHPLVLLNNRQLLIFSTLYLRTNVSFAYHACLLLFMFSKRPGASKVLICLWWAVLTFLGTFLSLNSVYYIVRITLSQTTHRTIVKPYYCDVGDIAQRERWLLYEHEGSRHGTASPAPKLNTDDKCL